MKDFLKLCLVVLIIIIIVVLFFRYSLLYAFPFVVALFISILIDPIVHILETNLKINRTISTLIVILAFSSFAIFALTLGISRLVFEIGNLIRFLPRYYVTMEASLSQLLLELSDQFERLPPEVFQTLQGDFLQFYNSIYITIRNIIDTIAATIFSIFALMPNLLLVTIVAMIATFFFTRDKDLIYKGMIRMLPLEVRHGAERIHSEVMNSLLGFIKSQAILITITTIITILGFMILRIQYALILGLISGILDLLPILGPGLVIIPMTLYQLISGNYFQGFGLLVLYGMMVLTRSILQAKVIGKNIGLHPLATLISIYVGLTVIGVWGIIFGPLLVIFVRSFVNSGIINYKK
jgi:sporulation integral membrane protein YtvI